MSRTIGRKRSHRSPPGDTQRCCSYCGIPWYRSQLTRDASGNLACPDELPGRDVVTLNEGNLAWYSSRRQLGDSGMPADGTVPAKSTGVAPVVDWNGPSVAAPFVPNFGMMWVCNFVIGFNVFGFSLAQAANPGVNDAPAVTLALPVIGPTVNSRPASIALDAQGNLWVGYADGVAVGQIVAMFSASKLLVSGAITADIVIEMPTTGNDANAIVEMAFAPNGDLWVGTGINPAQSHEIIGFAAANLLASGQPAPIARVRISPTAQVNGMRFDAAGTLWVAQFNSSIVAGLTAGQLLANNAALVPAIQLTMGTGYGNVLFDALGQMWLINFTANRLDVLATASLAVSGSPVPIRRIAIGSGSPQQGQFDSSGNLWVAEFASGRASGFGVMDIATSGSANARCSLRGAGTISSPIGLQLTAGANG